MKEFLNNLWKYLLACIIGFVIGILVNIPSCKKLESKIEYVPVHDTITIEKERIVNHTKILYVTDTIIKVDSFLVEKVDGTYVQIPIEYKTYKDTIKTDSTNTEIKIDYHGAYSNIDSVRVYNDYLKTREIIIQEPKRWGIDVTVGPYLGYGINYNGRNPDAYKFKGGVEVGLGVMIGVSYRITK